jgi:hypothetical protein
VLQSIQINFDEKIIGVLFISEHISTPCSLFGPKLHNCNLAITGEPYFSIKLLKKLIVEMKKSYFPVLELKYSFVLPLTRFFSGPKNRVKGGVP